MDSFFDTNVVVSYSNYHQELKGQVSPIIKKCYFYIANKQGRFIICGAVLEELNEVIKKRARIHKAVIDKIQNPNYSFENSPFISKKDVPFMKKLYERFKNGDIKRVADYFRLERRASEIAIQNFLETSVDEKVIPPEQIDNNLINQIHDIISNHADCKIIASAIQLQDSRDSFLFVTADSKDLDPNGYEFLKEHFRANYQKEKHKFPELLNLLFTN